MSFYDDASLVFLAGGAAGKDGKAYNLKPVEELSSTEVVINGDFSIDGPGTDGELGTGYGDYGWNTVSPSAGTQEGTTTISNGVLKLTNASGETDSRAYATDGVSSRNVITTNTYYKLVYTIVENNGCTSFKVYNAGGVQEDAPSSVGTHTVTLRNTANQLFLFFNKTESSSISIDNVSIREITNQLADFTFTRGTNLTATRVGKDGYIEKGRENLLLQSNQFDTTWVATSITLTSGQAGYDGSTDAWKMEKTASGFAQIEQNVSLSGVNTFSVYAKAGTLDVVSLFFRNNSGQPTTVKYNLTTKTADVFNNYNYISNHIEDVGGGWFRCAMTYEHVSGNTLRIYPDYEETDAGYIYIQDAQLERGLVATDYIETGATTATAGLLEDEPRFDYTGGGCPALLMEPTRTNLFVQSEYLASSSIFKTNSSFTTNQGISPEGLNNAAKMNEGTASGDLPHNFYYSGIQNSKTYTISFYAKKIDRDLVYVNIYSGVDSKFVLYDLSDGSVVTTSLGDVTASINDAGNGWYRISYTRDTAASGSPNFRIGMSSGVGIIDYQGNGSETLFYGVQWEEGSYPTSYIPTYGSSATRAKEDTADSYDQINTLDLSSSGLNGEDVSWFFEFRNNQDIIRDDSYPNVRVSEDSTNVGAFRIYRSVTSTTQLKVVFTDNSSSSSPASYTITSDNPKVLIKRTWSTGRIQLYVDGVPVRDEINLNFDRWYKLDLAGHGSVTELKQILAFPTVLSNNDSEILTGTSYNSFADMATSTPLNYTIYE